MPEDGEVKKRYYRHYKKATSQVFEVTGNLPQVIKQWRCETCGETSFRMVSERG
jgi:rubrerythrin